MEKGIAIRVENVKKDFKVYFDKGGSLKEKILFHDRNRFERREVLKGISFDVKKGEAIGLVGKNGCGKSTMLKMLTKIMYPSSGSVTTQGRISALIELGAGFHPDMSGRENIYTNAAIFGLSRQEIDSRLQAIIDFSELGSYIDNPVRTYSSGMYMRLAFAVAINVDADILLIDEILAVGDAAFQAKCFNKLREIKAKGTTIVIVSHSLGQIEQICDRSIWISEGRIRLEGSPLDVHPAYMEYMGNQNSVADAPQQEEEQQEAQQPSAEEAVAEAAPEEEKDPNRWGNGDARVTGIRLLDDGGKERDRFQTGKPMTIEISYETRRELKNPVCGIGIFRNDGLQCYGTNTHIDRIGALKMGRSGKMVCSIERNELLPGEYTLDVAIHAEDGFAYDYFRFGKRFQMYSSIADVGIGRLSHRWDLQVNKE